MFAWCSQKIGSFADSATEPMSVEIEALEGDDRPTPEDILLLDRIATDDESVRSLLP